MSMSSERSIWMYGIALCRPRQFHVAMETVDGLTTCDCGGCECRVEGGPGDLLLQTLTKWEILLEESRALCKHSLRILTFKVLTLILTTDRAGHPISSLMMSVSNEGFPWGKMMQI